AERDAHGQPAWLQYVERLRDLYRERRDTMLEALQEHLGERASWTNPAGGLFVWATLDGDVDTTDLLARSQGVAFVPGRAAYVDGRSGSSSMRLNFAGLPEQDIREGVRRIARAIGPDTSLLGALTGQARAGTADSGAAGGKQDVQAVLDAELADVIELPRREQQTPRRRQDR
ncbi:MAG TPA: aminotransferase class I/II-fold pyridoxal phosphate-dependent enzyme, partial [Solirubrobacteraceae bacterium]|nr:aminotransferase class I/II-fold pyridoxal phosphate-dependent enzyme [Solirubrobacteraceae bacterium]